MNLNNFLDGLAKEKFLVIFMLTWAGVFFFGTIDSYLSAINTYIVKGYEATPYTYALNFARLFDLGAGIILALLSLKMLIPNFMPKLKRELALLYFLLIWAGGFFFGGIADIVYYGTTTISGYDIAGIFAMIVKFAAGAVLALFTWKLLQDKSGSSLQEKLQTAVNQTP
jgi:hypothetical protein